MCVLSENSYILLNYTYITLKYKCNITLEMCISTHIDFLICTYYKKTVFDLHCKKNICKIYGKNQQLWLPEFYRKKYGSNILGFTVLT